MYKRYALTIKNQSVPYFGCKGILFSVVADFTITENSA